MGQLTIAWEYLTGCCVATDVADSQRAEWPPHPARIFMALAAALFETERDEAEGAALRWLETLGDPKLLLPKAESVFARSVVDVFVPVNGDWAKDTFPAKATTNLQSAPAIMRNKQPRTFPTTWVGDVICYAQWAEASDLQQQADALNRLCSKVTRIGHPSSLVRMWVANGPVAKDDSVELWHPSDALPEIQLRRISPDFLELLSNLYGEPARAKYAALTDQINVLKAEKKAVRGKGATKAKAEIDSQIKVVEAQLGTIDPRPPIRPVIGLWRGYRRVEPVASPDVAHSQFDTDLLILTQLSGPRLPLETTFQVTQALRGTVMARWGFQPPPEWVSGHSADGKPSKRREGHLALIPLPFVGHAHADGRLLGVALAFPRSVDRRERGQCIGPLLLDDQDRPRTVELTLGELGVWQLAKRDWSEPRYSLRSETWTANPKGATTWASVTPIVLDRFPKSDRLKDRASWHEEVAAIVGDSCQRIGLPEPVEVDLDTTSWHRGVPRSVGKRRRLRRGDEGTSFTDAPFGDGFPPFPSKGTNAPRPQVHIWLRFDQPVVGPLLIGAGRYLGYGLCRPLWEKKEAV